MSFKAGTDDVRMSPSIEIIKHLLKDNFQITAFDPEAIENSQKMLGNKITYSKNTQECFDSAKHIAILTEWSEFKEIKNYDNFNNKIIIISSIDFISIYFTNIFYINYTHITDSSQNFISSIAKSALNPVPF